MPRTARTGCSGEPVIRPRGESQPNTEIFRRLAARFGFTDRAFTASDAELMDDAMDASDPRLGGVRPSALPTDRALAMTVGGEDAVMFVNVFPKTASGKIELASSYLDQKYGQRLPSYRPYETPYPLLLISPASDRRITSTFGNLALELGWRRRSRCTPTTRGRGASSNGMRIKMWNELGEVHLPLAITDAVRPGVVVLAEGRVVQDERQRPDGFRARARPPRRPRRGRLLQRHARRGGRLPELVGDLLPVADGHGDREQRGM